MHSVIVWFNSTEQMLSEVMDIVPYETAHEDFWSPKLVTILLEACSQLDSLLKHQAALSAYTKKGRLDIGHYFQYFGEYLSPKWAIFWGEAPEKIKPFDKWTGATFKRDLYPKNYPLEWWEAYNAIKHDRIQNRKEATYKRAVQALAGLFVAILYCEVTRKAVGASGWLQYPNPNMNPVSCLEDHVNPMPLQYVLAETNLFSYPAGWMKKKIHSNLLWAGPASARFSLWFQEQSDA